MNKVTGDSQLTDNLPLPLLPNHHVSFFPPASPSPTSLELSEGALNLLRDSMRSEAKRPSYDVLGLPLL